MRWRNFLILTSEWEWFFAMHESWRFAESLATFDFFWEASSRLHASELIWYVSRLSIVRATPMACLAMSGRRSWQIYKSKVSFTSIEVESSESIPRNRLWIVQKNEISRKIGYISFKNFSSFESTWIYACKGAFVELFFHLLIKYFSFFLHVNEWNIFVFSRTSFSSCTKKWDFM